MCYVIALGALCAVFAPVPARADAPPPPAVAQAPAAAQPALQRAVIPAGRPVGEATAISVDFPEGRRGESLSGEGLRPAPKESRAAALDSSSRASHSLARETEAKSSSYESGEAVYAEARDIERK